MSEYISFSPMFGAFVIASVLLAVTPGPGVFYIVARSLTEGRLSGLASVAGVALGNLGNAIGASLGLAALFAMSSLAFTIVKYLGAFYLFYLGVQAIRSTRIVAQCDEAPLPGAPRRRIFFDGFVVALLNPKTAIFFAAFLPQFIEALSAPVAQTITLGIVFVLIAATTDTIYAFTAGAVRPWLQHAKGVAAVAKYGSGSALIGLGILTAFSGQQPKS
ncbi:MAG: LysE family translocator [Betaproteobacteria bacterium]|nr:LysE family translocator [Betaproteobacteria bacterium]